MSDFVIVNLFVLLFRTIMVLVGLAFAYLGYSLFKIGVYEKAGELKAAWGDRNLALKQAAPGTFFALFGVIVVGISVMRGADLHSATTFAAADSRRSGGEAAQHEPPARIVTQTFDKPNGLGVDDSTESPASPPPELTPQEMSEGLIARLIADGATDIVATDSLYLAMLGRFPTDQEKNSVNAHIVGRSTDKKEVLSDIAWAIMNSKEFKQRSGSSRENAKSP